MFVTCPNSLFSCERQQPSTHRSRPARQTTRVKGVPDNHHIIARQPRSFEDVAEVELTRWVDIHNRSPWGLPRKPREAVAWRLEPFRAAIDAMLTEDTAAPRKQRHTARRILARLIEEHGAEELSYSTVRDYVRIRRAEIDVEAGRRVEAFIPQEHAPGAGG